MMLKSGILLAALALFSCTKTTETSNDRSAQSQDSPRIVNFVNFIRQSEPRSDDPDIGEKLYETVVQQISQLNQYKLPGTFLIQYDALINPKYQELLKNELGSDSEVGAWWEITQPHVEQAGLKWRGRFSWDWHADVGFATGYTPEEREKLVDVYMEKFKSVFGKYPVSVASWFIDAHTLGYLYDKYHIVASANCKDQIGTDGYTLWGGYWNQAYYPSRKNAYMPAQNTSEQIPVPIFRMLGSDPIYQYEHGLGNSAQGVVTLEPASGEGGYRREWVEWFFKTMFVEPSLGFNYVQAGQENSFLWENMKSGFEIQVPILDSLRKQGKIRIETLETSGRWFSKKYAVTPTTAVTALTDYKNLGNKTVWFNSRYYRANLMWEQDKFRFRDIHLFDERFASDYLTKAGKSTQVIYTTLPIVDGFSWSQRAHQAGLRLVDGDGSYSEIGSPTVTEETGQLKVAFATVSGNEFVLTFFEDRFEIYGPEHDNWSLELDTAPGTKLPFHQIEDQRLKASLKGFKYEIACTKGKISKSVSGGFRLSPSGGRVVVDCSKRL